MSELELQYPFWFVLLCAALGASFALLVYWRGGGFLKGRPALAILLGLLRFIAGTVIAILLLSPVLKSIDEEVKKPVIVIAQDASQSVLIDSDSGDLVQYRMAMEGLASQLAVKYDVRTYAFGEEVRQGFDWRFDDKSSNLSAMLRHIGELYGDQHLGAVVMASDGIYNEGHNPLYGSYRLAAPIYTVSLGDTTPDNDVMVVQVLHNKIGYLGDRSTVQVDIRAYGGAGQTVPARLLHVSGNGTNLVASQNIRIDSRDHFSTIELVVKLDEPGLQRFRVVVGSLPDERTTVNNQRDFFIEVIDAKQKILILAASPHPDLATLKASFESNANYEVELKLSKAFNGNLDAFDMVVLHQLPSRAIQNNTYLRRVIDSKLPLMLVIGAQTNISALSQMTKLQDVRPRGAATNQVTAVYNPAFSLFRLNVETQQGLGLFPPLDAPFAEYALGGSAEALLYQRLGNIDTDYPLLIVGEQAGTRMAIWNGEGLWRWRLQDFVRRGSHETFDHLINQIVQFVTLKEDRRRFRVTQAADLWTENEEVRLFGELYNRSYQLVNEPEVQIEIRNSAGDNFQYAFSRRGQQYFLNAGRLPVDDYRWTASTQFEGERYTASGQFSIQGIEKESFVLVADHQLLHQLAVQSGGTMVDRAKVAQLADQLENDQSLKPLYARVMQTRNAINLKWIFGFLLLLMTAEWAIRRYMGSY